MISLAIQELQEPYKCHYWKLCNFEVGENLDPDRKLTSY